MTRKSGLGAFLGLLLLVLAAALTDGGAALAAGPVPATQHGPVGHPAPAHVDHDHGHAVHRGPSVGVLFGAPAYVAPPPVYYAPAYPTYGAYPYAPVPVSGIYASPYGYCRNYRTMAGIETACQGADGVWRFIN